MQQVVFISQILISVALIILILLQQRSGGLSSVFGGGGSVYRTKRGLEKGLFILTIILAILFVSIGVLNLAFSS